MGDFKMELKTIKIKLSNLEIRAKLLSLQPILNQRGVIGYIAARNARVLTNALTEYSRFEREAIIKYGTSDLDSNGKSLGTTSIKPSSDKFDQFIKEMDPLQKIQQDISITIAKYDDVIGVLSGEEILAIDWMLED